MSAWLRSSEGQSTAASRRKLRTYVILRYAEGSGLDGRTTHDPSGVPEDDNPPVKSHHPALVTAATKSPAGRAAMTTRPARPRRSFASSSWPAAIAAFAPASAAPPAPSSPDPHAPSAHPAA